MAVRFDADTDRLSYGAAAPPSTFTLTAWVYLSVDRGTWSTFAQIRDSSDTTVAEAASPSGTSGPFYWDNSSGFSNSTGFVVGEWRKFAMTRSGSSGQLLCATPTGSTTVSSGTVTTGTPDRLTLGARGPGDTSQWWNGRLCRVRIWSSVLTQTEIETEWASATPVKTSTIWADWPLSTATDLTDTTNSRTLTTGTTGVTTEADPGTDYTQTITDSLGLADSTAQAFAGSQTITDLLGLSDSTATAAAYSPTVTDLLGLLDTSSTASNYAPSVTDLLGLTDAAVPAMGFTRSVTDTLGLLDPTPTTSLGTATLRPTTELVAVAWLSGVDGLSTGMVATQLPRDTSAWKATGFVTVRVVGGSPGMYTPLRQPVIAVDAWAVNPTSNKPPWWQANALMEAIDQGCRAGNAQRWLTLPDRYLQARVTTAYWVTEPQRVYLDQGGYARYTANLQLNWVAAVSN